MPVPVIKKVPFFIILVLLATQVAGQNAISFTAGYLGTHTSVAEYERINRVDQLLDSMKLYPNVGSFQATLATDIGLGKNLFLTAGFHYSYKGLKEVDFFDSTGYPWHTAARQHYVGISLLIGYKYHFRDSKWGIQLSTGPQVDFGVGMPNAGTLFSGPYYRFFMPFCRFNEVDLSWSAELGCYYKLGPGDIVLRAKYLYGLSDVLEDPFVIGRTMSVGVSMGYSFPLGK